MTKIIKLNTINDSDDFISYFKDKELLVYEDIQGSVIFVNWNGEDVVIKPKSLNNESLNFIDLTIQKFYNKAFYYFSTLPDYIKDLLPENWWFCFEYFPDNQPGNIEYEKKPKNNLILTCIVKNNKYFYSYEELKEFANLFDVDILPILFKGKLTYKQLELLQAYLKVSPKDLNYVFGEKNFAQFFYNILNPQLKNSYLMDNGNFNENIEKIIFKIENDTQYSFELLNPIYQKISKNNFTEYVDIYTLILLNFLQYVQLINILKYKMKDVYDKDQLYISYICEIFNEYYEDTKHDLKEWDFNIPPFFQKEIFEINKDLIPNEKTKEIINSSKKIEYIFKVILGSFYKKKRKPIGIFTEQTIILFNNFVEEFHKHIDKQLKINRDVELQKTDIKNFNDYWNLKYNSDIEGRIYPDIYSQFEEDEGESKKKKLEKGMKKSEELPGKEYDKLSGFSLDKEEVK